MGLAHSPSVITDGLMVYLDAANTRSYPGTGNTWYDLRGNRNFTLQNNPPFFANNILASVLSFKSIPLGPDILTSPFT